MAQPVKPTPDELRQITEKLDGVLDQFRHGNTFSAFERALKLKEHIEYLASRKN